MCKHLHSSVQYLALQSAVTPTPGCSNSHSNVQNLDDFELLDHPIERHTVHQPTRLIYLHIKQLDNYIIHQITKLRKTKSETNEIKTN